MNTEHIEKFVNAIACDLEEGGFRQVSGTTLRRSLTEAVASALPLLAEQQAFHRSALMHALSDAFSAGAEGLQFAGGARCDALLGALAATGKQQAVDGCTESNCSRCRTHPDHRGDMPHAGIGSTVEQQVGEVQGDALAAINRVVEQLEYMERGCRIHPDYLDDARVAQAALAARQPGAQVPVAVVGSDFTLLWAGSGPIAPIVERHGLKRGSLLYAAPPAQGIDLEPMRTLVAAVEKEFCCEATEENEPDDSKVSYPEETCPITFGMIRAARRAIGGQRDAAPGVE